VICSVQVDILTTNWQISLPLFQLAYWSFQYFRHKPPWSYINKIISWFFCHTSHIIKPPWSLYHKRHGLNRLWRTRIPCIRSPCARRLQICLLLLMLQVVQALDLRTCHLLDMMFGCFLLLLCWRPYIVFITVTPMVVLPLLWLAFYSAYRVLFDLLVNFADHLILVGGNIHRALSDNLVNITVYLILLSFWGAALVVLCIEGLGLDLHALPDCLVTVFDQVATYPAGASGEGTSRCFSGTRTMSTNSLDSMGTMDTVTTSSETPGAFTSSPKFNFGSGVASGTSGIAGNDFMVSSSRSFRFGSFPSPEGYATVGSLDTVPTFCETPGWLNSTPKFNFGSCGPMNNAGIGNSGFMVPPSGYFRFGSSLSPEGNIYAIPNTFFPRKFVRAKSSLLPATLSVTHSLPTTAGAYLEFTASTSPNESIHSSESQSEFSDNISIYSDSFSTSSDVHEPIYLKYSDDSDRWEAFPLRSRSPDEIEQHLQACEALRYEQFKQLCEVESQCTMPIPEPVQSSEFPL